MKLIERNNELLEVPFNEIICGDVVYLDGTVNANRVVCAGDASITDGTCFLAEKSASGSGEYITITPEVLKESKLPSIGGRPKRIWCRIGVTLSLTKYDEEILFGSDPEAAAACFKRLLTTQKLVPEGNSYIPDECIEQFNATYGTNYSTEMSLEIDF